MNSTPSLSIRIRFCREHKAGLLLLSSSRVYSIPELAAIPLCVHDQAFAIDLTVPLPPGLSADGIGVEFSTAAPVSRFSSLTFLFSPFKPPQLPLRPLAS